MNVLNALNHVSLGFEKGHLQQDIIQNELTIHLDSSFGVKLLCSLTNVLLEQSSRKDIRECVGAMAEKESEIFSALYSFISHAPVANKVDLVCVLLLHRPIDNRHHASSTISKFPNSQLSQIVD